MIYTIFQKITLINIRINEGILFKLMCLFFFLSLSSCYTENKNEKSKNKNLTNLKLVDSITLQNPLDGYFMSWDTQVVNFDNATLARLSYSTVPGLEYFDLFNATFIKKNKFIVEGDEGIGQVQGFYIINKDSIAIFNERKLVLLNNSFQKLRSYNYMDNYDKLWYVLQDSNRGQRVYEDGKLFFGKTDFEFSNTNAFYKSKLSAYVDLKSGEFVEQDGITFPENYFDKCWGDYTISLFRDYNKEGQHFIYSFPANHNLYIYDPFIDKITKEVKVKSDFLPDEIESMNCKYYDDYLKEREYYLKTGKYLKILHDPYKKLYYRFVELPMSIEDAIYYSGRSDALFSTSIVLMVLDEDFKVLNEFKLPDNKYIHWDFFVLEDGLYISANNPNNPNFNEDELIYHRFEIEFK